MWQGVDSATRRGRRREEQEGSGCGLCHAQREVEEKKWRIRSQSVDSDKMDAQVAGLGRCLRMHSNRTSSQEIRMYVGAYEHGKPIQSARLAGWTTIASLTLHQSFGSPASRGSFRRHATGARLRASGRRRCRCPCSPVPAAPSSAQALPQNG